MSDLKGYDSPPSPGFEHELTWWSKLSDSEKQDKIRAERLLDAKTKQKIDIVKIGVITEEHQRLSDGKESTIFRRDYFAPSTKLNRVFPGDSVRVDLSGKNLNELHVRKGLSAEQSQSFFYNGDVFMFLASDHQQNMQVRYNPAGSLQLISTLEFDSSDQTQPSKVTKQVVLDELGLEKVRKGEALDMGKYSAEYDKSNHEFKLTKKIKAEDLPVSLRQGAEDDEEVNLAVLTVPDSFDFNTYFEEILPKHQFPDFFTPDFNDDMVWRDKDIIKEAGIIFSPYSDIEIRNSKNLLLFTNPDVNERI